MFPKQPKTDAVCIYHVCVVFISPGYAHLEWPLHYVAVNRYHIGNTLSTCISWVSMWCCTIYKKHYSRFHNPFGELASSASDGRIGMLE